MIKLYNDILPLKGFKALNICGILFVRKGKVLSDRNIRHEQIHTCQMKELLYIGFYLWYAVEWLVRLLMCMNAKRAYYDISFEREAYTHEGDMEYLGKRRRYEWFRLLTKIYSIMKNLKEKLASWTWFGLIGFLLSILVAVIFNQSDGVDNEKLIILSPAIGFIISAFFEMWLSYKRTKELEKEGVIGYTGPSVGTEVLKSLIGSIVAALAIAGLIL